MYVTMRKYTLPVKFGGSPLNAPGGGATCLVNVVTHLLVAIATNVTDVTCVQYGRRVHN